jgi:hypothetical protein
MWNGNTLPDMWQAYPVADRIGSDALLRLSALGGVEAEAGAARVFTGLVADQVWVLDTDVPAEGARPRALNEWRVAGRLAPDLEQALRSSPGLIGETARALAARSFPPGQTEDVLAAVGLLESSDAGSLDRPSQVIPEDMGRHRRHVFTDRRSPALVLSEEPAPALSTGNTRADPTRFTGSATARRAARGAASKERSPRVRGASASRADSEIRQCLPQRRTLRFSLASWPG